MIAAVSVAGVLCAGGIVLMLFAYLLYLCTGEARLTDAMGTVGAIAFILGVIVFVCAGLTAYLQAIH